MPKKSTFEEEYRKALAVYDSIVSEWEELGYRKGYQEGYRKGYQKGYQEVIEKAYQEGIEKGCQEAKKQIILKGQEYGVSMAILSLITHSSEELS